MGCAGSKEGDGAKYKRRASENGGNDELVVTLKATIALLESKLAAKDAGIVVLYDGAQYFVGTHYSEGCQVARLLFSKAERQALVELARQMDLGLGRMVQGMIKFMSNPAHWEQHASDASRGMVMSPAMQRGAAGKAAREECFLGDFKVLQKGVAAKMTAIVTGWTGRVLANLAKATGTDPVAVRAVELAKSPTKPHHTVPACFVGVLSHNTQVPEAEWGAEVTTTLKTAGALLEKRKAEGKDAVPELQYVPSTTPGDADYDDNLVMIPGSYQKHHKASHLEYILAVYTCAAAPTYARMAELFAGVVEAPLQFGKLKNGKRAGTKAKEYAAEGLAKPATQWVVDFLRITVPVEDNTELVGGFLELENSEYEVVVTKDRRLQKTADVLVVVQLPSKHVPAGVAGPLYCEVQFSFRAVLAVKAFLHSAYTVERCPAGDLQKITASGLFEAPAINLQDIADWSKVVKCKVKFD